MADQGFTDHPAYRESPNADSVGHLPTYRRVHRWRLRFKCSLCGAHIQLADTIRHSNWHLSHNGSYGTDQAES